MDQFNTLFVHISCYRVAVCKECHVGIVKANIARHLDTRHANLTRSTLQEIARAARAIEELAEGEDQVVYPGPDSEPVPHLTVWRDGLKCTRCGYIRRTIQDCREQHGWANPRKRGRMAKGYRAEVSRLNLRWKLKGILLYIHEA
ncbi:hypothetical protein M501DRAFT_928389 [Patellaria atrata CBS 101060]|uniref:Uncharacterized protein n=1 Tax=Patellaria atrata CBS 101060 TaxID=1346257 RepID=A0A9P4SGM7_9PEZI|nr:hypothetical protein M501DRAFT_928389 [Patellaria atrata CBS 101060]